jgi:hypothetical protein
MHVCMWLIASTEETSKLLGSNDRIEDECYNIGRNKHSTHSFSLQFPELAITKGINPRNPSKSRSTFCSRDRR